jgi:4-hydroxyacetophenone monooxygenase
MHDADPRSVMTTATDEQLQAALAVGNIPTLLLVLAQLTGDPSWVSEQYRPTRTLALDDNDSGGLPDAAQAAVRSAAFEVLRGLRDGRREIPAPPPDDRITDLVGWSLGDEIPPEYGQTMAEEAGFHPRREVGWRAGRPGRADDLHVLVIGAGLSGIAVAATLNRLGIPYTIVDKDEAVGGVWWRNNYPGAGVDTPSNLYSYSFAPRPSWSRYYAKQPEILAYLQDTADRLGITGKVQFGTEVTKAVWDEGERRWRVDLRRSDGTTDTLSANVVVSCVGILSRKSIPALPGMDQFAGPLFHSSEWDHSVDLHGRRVAVIGTGATSQQIIPAIADEAAKVLVLQRSPQWVAPNGNYLRPMPEGVQLLMAQVPYYASFYRLRLIWQFQDKLLKSLRRDPEWPHPDRSVNASNDRHRAYFTRHIDDSLGERTDLRDKVLPTYPPYGKRILMDNGWIETIKRDDVELIAQAVTGFDEHHVLTADGGSHEADVVVLATGFQTSRLLAPMDIRGRSGVSLREQWGDDNPYAYLGISVPDFPNLFIVGGPNTALAHGGSYFYTAECAIAYLSQLIIRLAEDDLDAVEVRRDVTEAFNRRVDSEHEQLIWTHPGMTNWYKNAAGRVVAATPFRAVDYWAMTRTPDLADYVTTPARPPAAASLPRSAAKDLQAAGADLTGIGALASANWSRGRNGIGHRNRRSTWPTAAPTPTATARQRSTTAARYRRRSECPRCRHRIRRELPGSAAPAEVVSPA